MKMFGAKRITALILLFVMLAAGASTAFASGSKYYLNKNSDGMVDVVLRIFVPSKKSSPKSIGHYDLMIKGQLHFKGKTFDDPVFSYRTDGSMEVFSADDTAKVYKHSKRSDYYYGVHMYTYRKRVKGLSSVYKFIDTIGGHVKSTHTHPNCKRALKCELKGVYSKYKVKYVNCYLAAAKWMEIFGEDEFMDYYNGYYKGKKSSYLPRTVVKKFRHKMKKVF